MIFIIKIVKETQGQKQKRNMENITGNDVTHYFNGYHFGYVMVSSIF